MTGLMSGEHNDDPITQIVSLSAIRVIATPCAMREALTATGPIRPILTMIAVTSPEGQAERLATARAERHHAATRTANLTSTLVTMSGLANEAMRPLTASGRTTVVTPFVAIA